MDLARLTGRGVRVGIIDSGVNPSHPHIGEIAGGVFLGPRGESDVYLDYLGHGTAVAAAIQEKAPEAELYAVKVFDRALRTNIDRIARAIEWCIEKRMHLVNLSLGTANPEHRARFEPLIERAADAGMALIAARSSLPGCLPGVIAVDLDWECPRDRYRYADGCFYASGYPRPIPGVPPVRNLNGASFAVVNLTGFAALSAQICAGSGLKETLVEHVVTLSAFPRP